MQMRGAIALVVVALVAGCGDEKKDPFGEVSRADRIRFTDANNYIGRFWFENADWVKAVNRGNARRARREFADAREAVADARAVIDRMNNPKLRSWLGGYVATIEDYVAAGRRLMRGGRHSPAEVNAAAERIVRKETELVRYLSDYVPEEYMDEFRARFQ